MSRTLVISPADAAELRRYLCSAAESVPRAADWMRHATDMLDRYARPKCRTSTCSEPVATLRDGSPDPDGWCWSCAEREPECSSCGDVIEDTGSLCQRCATVEHALIEADRRRDEEGL